MYQSKPIKCEWYEHLYVYYWQKLNKILYTFLCRNKSKYVDLTKNNVNSRANDSKKVNNKSINSSNNDGDIFNVS